MWVGLRENSDGEISWKTSIWNMKDMGGYQDGSYRKQFVRMGYGMKCLRTASSGGFW
jgi:hypothetical protein